VSLGIYLNGELVQPVCACDTMTYSWNTKPYKGRVVRIQASAKDVDGQITTVSTTAQVAP
jgi:hypothetical protein